MPLPAPLNRLPLGLLDFLGIKTNGRYPGELRNDVQPVFDLFMQYAMSYADEYTLTTAGQAGSVNSGFTAITGFSGTSTDLNIAGGVVNVPNNELWFIINGATYMTLPVEAGAMGRSALSISIASGISMALPCVFQGFDTSNASHTRASVAALESPAWLRAGATIFIQHFGTVSVGNIAISARMRVCRMRV